MELAEQERKIVHVTKANSFKRTIKDVELEANELNDKIKTNMSRQLHARRLENTDKNVWVEFVQLAAEYNVVNLGQGFPDFSPPSFLLEYLYNAIKGGSSMHQYTRVFGHPPLVKSLAKFYGRILAREIDPMQEILVSVGAYGALFCAFQALIDEGDEVIIVEPFFDCYESMTLMAGGKPVYIPLKPQKVTGPTVSSADWVLCPEELGSKFNSRTKAIVINTPNNPLGKVFQREELQMIADLCIKHDVICFSDEVYEWLTYDGAQHIKMSSLPDMWERTITIGSAGKCFSATGWKVGWAMGPGHLLKHLCTVHQNSLYHCPTLSQEAFAAAFEREYELFGTEESYFKQLPKQLQAKRLSLVECLKSIGLQPFMPEGGYFIMADISSLKVDLNDASSKDEPYDYRFVKWLIKEKRLGTIPVSAFYSAESRADFQKYVRFCFVKDDSTLKAAEDILRRWKDQK
ncbi:kynurenine--oxoglutarate transaminase 1-like isoform X2 [Neoarius graeffei]|uniref:kynurenine--oxoglutarate transaminase 1-like isoform X2 n=1 Tax=Neoarius graeffei TaxID=443677 RepID=UPI00298CFDC9|nr:kynurenine--oxoglutarate transaminase 1-like isoform X2 [Neoarius graeffei]